MEAKQETEKTPFQIAKEEFLSAEKELAAARIKLNKAKDDLITAQTEFIRAADEVNKKQAIIVNHSFGMRDSRIQQLTKQLQEAQPQKPAESTKTNK